MNPTATLSALQGAEASLAGTIQQTDGPRRAPSHESSTRRKPRSRKRQP